MWVFFVIRYEVIMNAAVIHPVSRQWGPDKDDNKTRSADNWTRTAVELCRNSDDICCPWQDIIVAMIVRCSRSREMLDGRAAKPDVTICPFAGQLLKPRLDVGDDASMTDGIATSAHISHASSSTLQCTLFSSVLHYHSSVAVSATGAVRAALSALFCHPLVNRLRLVCRMNDCRLIAWICRECYSSAEPVPHKRITLRIPPSRVRVCSRV